MPTNIACTHCNAKYKVPIKFLGKAVKCQKCGNSFKAKPLASATPKNAAAKQPTSTSSTNPQKQELSKFGLDGPIVAESNDLFGAPPTASAGPLGNHATDPGFSAFEPTQHEEENTEVSDLFTNPALPQQKAKKSMGAERPTKTKSKRGASDSPKLIKQPWFLLLIGLGLLTVGCVTTALIGGKDLVIVLAIGHGICGLASMVVSIWGIVLAYETTRDATTLVLCILVPFYMLYFVITHFSEMRGFVWATLVVVVLQFVYIPFYFISAFAS